MERFGLAIGTRTDQDLDLVDSLHYPRQFKQDNVSYAVGTTYVQLCNAVGANNVSGSRKKVSGGTVTSVKIQGLSGNDSESWADILTLADATPGAKTLGAYAAAELVGYEKLRLEIIIAVSAVVLDWSVLVK